MLDSDNSASDAVSVASVPDEVSDSVDPKRVTDDQRYVNKTKLQSSGITTSSEPLVYSWGKHAPYLFLTFFPVMVWFWIPTTVPVVGCLWHQFVMGCQRVWTLNPQEETKGTLTLPNSDGIESPRTAGSRQQCQWWGACGVSPWQGIR